MSNVQFDSFQQNFQATLEKFQEFKTIYQKASQYLKPDQQQHFETKINRWIAQLQKPEFPIAFLGTYSVGKSTIINALIFQDLLPDKIKPTTAFPTIIKKGNVEKGVIYFISESKAKEQIRQLFALIQNDLGKNNLPELRKIFTNTDENSTHLFIDSLNNAIKKHESEKSSSYDRKYCDQLVELVDGWNKFLPYAGHQTEIPLADVKNYIEGNSYTIFIEKMEINLVDFDVPSGIVLVDLPGLAVANDRHIEFTKNYIKNEAKSCVICGNFDHLVGKDEMNVLEETKNNNSTILQRSFWVVNKWDGISPEQKAQVEEDYQDKQRKFLIKDGRFFKFSALGYFLAKSFVENGELTEYLVSKINPSLSSSLSNNQGLLDLDKARNYLTTSSEVTSFSEFKIALFDHLKNTAINEFIADANLELFELVRKLLEDIPAIDEDFNQDQIVRKKIRQASDNFWQDIYLVIQEAYNSLTTIETNKLWDTVHTKYLTDSIEKIFSFTEADIESFKKELEPEYLHSDFNFARLPKIVDDKIYNQFSDDLEKTFDDAVKNIVSKMNELLRKIKAINPGYFPQEVIEHLEYLLGREQMLMRLRGNRDVLFLDLGAEIQSASFKVFDEYQKLEENQRITKTDEVKIKDALIIYKTEMINFIDNLAEPIDKVLRRTVKNHAKMIQENLNKFLKDQKESIDDVIDKQVSKKIDKNLEFEIQYETQKYQVIKEATDQLKLFL
jgi:GTP-binding protein EngB required for normal cell division